MPKMKTHKGTAKRFRKTSKGKLKRRRQHRNHLAEAKAPKNKRQARRPATVSDADEPRLKRMLGQ